MSPEASCRIGEYASCRFGSPRGRSWWLLCRVSALLTPQRTISQSVHCSLPWVFERTAPRSPIFTVFAAALSVCPARTPLWR